MLSLSMAAACSAIFCSSCKFCLHTAHHLRLALGCLILRCSAVHGLLCCTPFGPCACRPCRVVMNDDGVYCMVWLPCSVPGLLLVDVRCFLRGCNVYRTTGQQGDAAVGVLHASCGGVVYSYLYLPSCVFCSSQAMQQWVCCKLRVGVLYIASCTCLLLVMVCVCKYL